MKCLLDNEKRKTVKRFKQFGPVPQRCSQICFICFIHLPGQHRVMSGTYKILNDLILGIGSVVLTCFQHCFIPVNKPQAQTLKPWFT